MILSKKYTATSPLSVEDIHQLIAANTTEMTDLEIALNTDNLEKMFMGTYTFNSFKITMPSVNKKKKKAHPQIKGNVYSYNGITYVDLHYKASPFTLFFYSVFLIFVLFFASRLNGFTGVFALIVLSGFTISKLSIGGTYYTDRYKLHELLLLNEVGNKPTASKTAPTTSVKPDVELLKTDTHPAASASTSTIREEKSRKNEEQKPKSEEKEYNSPPIEKPKREDRLSPSRKKENPRRTSQERTGRYNRNER